jgi:hypothetical protein
MTRDKIQQLARNAGAYETEDALGEAIVLFNLAELAAFTGLVLEEAAKVAESRLHAGEAGPSIIVKAIRAMKPEVKT